MAPMYGQVVCGPPGSGKTTYCNGMQHYLSILGRRAAVINLDPANEVGQFVPSRDATSMDGNGGTTTNTNNTTNTTNNNNNSQLPYDTIFDVCEEVVNLSAVMDQTGLGPNGGLIYCMEYLQVHVEEICQLVKKSIEQYEKENSTTPKNQKTYLIIDLPGQVELYTHSTCVQQILHTLTTQLELRLTAVQLIDAHYCADPHKFLAAALLGTTTMIRLELPMVNVLSKVDLLTSQGMQNALPFGLEFFTECHDLARLVPYLDGGMGTLADDQDRDNNFTMEEEGWDYAEDPEYQKARQKTRSSKFFRKRAKLHEGLAEIVEDFGLLGFLPLDITHGESVGRVLAKIDKCNGYVFTSDANGGGSNNSMEDLFQCAVSNEMDNHGGTTVADIQERIQEQREWLLEQDKIRKQLKEQEEKEQDALDEQKPPNFPSARVVYKHPPKLGVRGGSSKKK